MTSKERILKAIRHEEPDRVPLNIWLYGDDYAPRVVEKYGSIDAFYERYGIDMYTVFAPPPSVGLRGRVNSIDDALEMQWHDPRDPALYENVRQAVERYGKQKQMAVFCQTGGVFETANGFIGMPNNLMNMLCEPQKTHDFYEKLSTWFQAQIEMIIDCGVDVVHLSDDWGQNDRMIFSPEAWWEFVFPHDKAMVDVGKRAGVPVSLHSCGHVMDVVDGCVAMGLDVLNPIQTSAGMDPYKIKREYGDKLCLYGTLDVRDVLPCYSLPELDAEAKRLMDGLKSGGGYIFCSAHTVNPDCPLESVEHAYECALKYGGYA